MHTVPLARKEMCREICERRARYESFFGYQTDVERCVRRCMQIAR